MKIKWREILSGFTLKRGGAHDQLPAAASIPSPNYKTMDRAIIELPVSSAIQETSSFSRVSTWREPFVGISRQTQPMYKVCRVCR